ncbi:pyrroline-5-carboxylate reductase [Bacillus sp. FJAT-42376]|uniref:pyrroline-5-carboxylate reductase n=1 Tax=Bacillus sp. FJAT-42376 TaxID=2014076 RepID=UPI000F514883|nr:pyrroline-5-carboxylate reductase [Bacillus sp. FJAT-42376]AZB43460.1 pyrroline-5-carboxylate reductase [Bacillus sp. FJAT-42376]
MMRIGILGAGSMAEAMISGLISGNVVRPDQISVINRSDRSKLLYIQDQYGVNVSENKEELLACSDVIILAMKPKDAQEAILSIRPYVKKQLFLSVLAGITIQTIQKLLGKKAPVIRAMPNTSAAIQMSATAISPSEEVTMHQLKIAKHLFETIGMVAVVEEHRLDAVTALSGSGPAYVYYFIEAMEHAASEVGLDKDIAKSLILQTLAGASEMLMQSDKQAAQLRREVTSPGGTTEAGIEKLKDCRFHEAIVACVKKAAERSVELQALVSKEEKKIRKA